MSLRFIADMTAWGRGYAERMDIEGLDYNTCRDKLKLMAYGRDIQQMVDHCVALPDRADRQRCAQTVIETMKRVAPSQMDNKERMAVLWYHLAMMSDFKLDIDYPVNIEHEDKMAIKPGKIEYADRRGNKIKHYGRLLLEIFKKLKTMEPGAERDALARKTAMQMYRCLTNWGMGTVDGDRIASDMARYTDGIIQLDADSLHFEHLQKNSGHNHGTAQADAQGKRKKRRKK